MKYGLTALQAERPTNRYPVLGNDYALDDLSFHVVPIPQTVWLLGTACLFVLGLKRKIVK
jgi:hypothetical protein